MATAPAGTSVLSKLNLPAKIGVGTAVFVVIAFAYWFIWYSDTSNKIVAAQKQTLDLKNKLKDKAQAQQSFLADKDELAAFQQRAREFNKVLPAESQEASFLSAIQQASNTSGIDLKGWQPQEEQPQAYYAKVPMRLELRGRYHQIMKFIYEIGKVDRIINVENIELNDPQLEGDEVRLKARCLATAFHTLKQTGGGK